MNQALYAHMNNKRKMKKKKEEIQIAKQHMKKCSLYLAIKEMQIKTTLRFHLIIKNSTTNRYWQGCGEKRTLVHCW
jgi:hypothetical protein